MSSQVVQVQQPIGVAWLILNWQLVLWSSLISLIPLYYFYTRYQRENQYARSLFDFTLAEQQRKNQNNLSALESAIKLYDKILNGACNAHLEWRCHFGRSVANLCFNGGSTSPQTKQAFVDASKAMELAQKLLVVKEEKEKKIKEEKEKEKEKAAKAKAESESKGAAAAATNDADAAGKNAQSSKDKKSASSSSSASAGATKPVATNEFDLDPFEDAPISLPALYYQRARCLDAMADYVGATSDYEAAIKLDSSKSFVQGYVATKELEERLKRGVPQGVQKK